MKKISSFLLILILGFSFVFVLQDSYAADKININTATVEELMTIKKIGRTLANRIVEYRTNVTSFKTVEDIMNVKGIGKKLFERIKDYITVE